MSHFYTTLVSSSILTFKLFQNLSLPKKTEEKVTSFTLQCTTCTGNDFRQPNLQTKKVAKMLQIYCKNVATNLQKCCKNVTQNMLHHTSHSLNVDVVLVQLDFRFVGTTSSGMTESKTQLYDLLIGDDGVTCPPT